MKRKLLLVTICLVSLISSCSSNKSSTKSKLPNDDKYLYLSPESFDIGYIQTKNFYVYRGSIIKENNRYYFIDTASTFHCSVFEDTRVYKNNDFFTYASNYEGIEEEKDCYIWVSCNISYSGPHSGHKDDRKMTFGNPMSLDFQGNGFYDHILDIYYGCNTSDIEKHDLDVTIELNPGVLDFLQDDED